MFDTTFRNIADVVREHAAARPQQPALVQGDRQLTFAELDALMDRVAVALQRDGVRAGDVIALCGSTTPQQAALFLGGLRAGALVAPLAPSVTSANRSSPMASGRKPRTTVVPCMQRPDLSGCRRRAG